MTEENLWEVHFTKTIEADSFFDAVDKVKEIEQDLESVISVCPYIEDDYTE